MDTIKKGRVFSAITASLLLVACGEEKAPANENQAPSLTVDKASVSVEEGKSATLGVSLTDDFSSLTDESLTLELKDMSGVALDKSQSFEGDALFDPETMEITYTAPWLSKRKSLNENFTVIATDQHGISSEAVVSVSVSDINDPVALKVVPPGRAYGYENTQKDEQINFWISEKDPIDVKFLIKESDADELTVDYSVTEGVVFENQVTATQSEDSESVTLSLPATKITTPSESFVLSLIVEDGDDTVTATANVTIVNKPQLSWTSGSPTSVSESSGVTLNFKSSEEQGYPGEYSAELTTADGEDLPFDVPVSVNGQTGEVFIGSASGFQGNFGATLRVKLTNSISHAGGESYPEVTELTRNITFIDDRDDGFNVAVDEFYEIKSQAEKARERKDENRVASAVGSYLFLKGFTDHKTVTEMKEAVSDALESDYSDMRLSERQIVEAIDDGEENSVIESLITDYKTKVKNIGLSAREKLNETVDVVVANLGEDEVFQIGRIKNFGESVSFGESITHFLGNSSYGAFTDREKTEWEFHQEYAYLSVVDYSGQFCF